MRVAVLLAVGVLLAAQLVGAAFVANYRHCEPRPAHTLPSARATCRHHPLLAAPGCFTNPPPSTRRRPRRATLCASGRGAHIVEARERFAKFFVTSDECASLDVTPVPIEGVRPEEFDGWLASQVRAEQPPSLSHVHAEDSVAGCGGAAVGRDNELQWQECWQRRQAPRHPICGYVHP